jgi:hypothetical protein
MDRGESGLSEAKGGRPPGGGSDPSDNVVPLGVEPPTPVAPAPSRPPSRLHGLAIIGMAVFALVGIAAMLAFITISWPDDSSRYVVAVFVASIVGFMTSASLAVFSAARDTYPRHPRKPAGE